MIWQILLKRLWFWRIVWNLRTTLFHILDPYILYFWIFFISCILKFFPWILKYLMYFLVNLCIYVLFPFKKQIQAHFELLCLYDFVDVISSCFVYILIWTFISIKYILFLFWFLPFCISFKKNHTFCFLYFYLFCNVSFYKIGYENSTFIFQKLNLILFQNLKKLLW